MKRILERKWHQTTGQDCEPRWSYLERMRRDAPMPNRLLTAEQWFGQIHALQIPELAET